MKIGFPLTWLSVFKMIGIRCNINTMSTLNVEIIIRNSLNASRGDSTRSRYFCGKVERAYAKLDMKL